MTEQTLSGKTAFVSGSGQNIGRAIALRLAGMGCNVVVNGSSDAESCRETARMVEQAGAQALVVMGDVGDAAAVDNMAAEALERFGTVDILVNNAARRPHKPFLEMTDADWDAVVDVALTAPFRTARAFLPGMVEKGWGRIINFAGMKAMRGYFEGAPISAAKHGVWGLTKALSTEFAPKGVTANVISPGQIRKETATEDDPKRTASIPAGVMGRPGDIAATAAFLASPEAGFITGQMIAVNGGEET
ncbi:SDR family NAD(P)-dependent oxidoreductase [Thalassococcus profundi]|uniref:SDR family NAD(P)-dependent oxidoreductase n=1 Tax=Thalassococcus profundi TaxID=2282382 RepID=A0A369TQM3_9RHOB|nr:SDR family oxidoreductase [Thalassococcus profundi]RDD67568.1 SDR family NAD(P)-dependent oxidoreductase [Thalassococcus profundi]